MTPTNKKYYDAYPFMALQPVGGKKLLELSRLVTDKVVMFVPRNMDLSDAVSYTHLTLPTILLV